MIKNRLSALDGLRGLAAFSVLLSHSGFALDSLPKIPFLIGTYRTLAVGPNSVQILFVLSGFLMAYLYPSIKSWTHFISKRYARIIPVFAVIVAALSIIKVQHKFTTWPEQMKLVLALAVSVFVIWTFLERVNLDKIVGKILLYGFLLLQLGMVFFNLFISPDIVTYGHINLPPNLQYLFVMLSNVTLTTPFGNGIPGLSGAFWSLAPEIYFYLIYPIIVIAIISISKKFGYLVTTVIVLALVKILFDLDHALVPIASLQSLNVARSSGFIMGVLAGTIYEGKGKIWQKIETLGKNNLISLLGLAGLIAIQWGDWAVRDGKSIAFINAYYLVSSVVLGMFILLAIIPNTVSNRIFSTRLLVLMGFISYSIYLIHSDTIGWAQEIEYVIANQFTLSTSAQNTVHLLLAVGITVIMATVLYKLVESLYFRSKNRSHTTLTQSTRPHVSEEKKPVSTYKIVLTAAVVIAFFSFAYMGAGYSPTFFLARHSFRDSNIQSHSEFSLLQDKIDVPITTQYPDLSEITVDTRYADDAALTISRRKEDSAVFYFRILDPNKNMIFESSRSAFNAEGTPRFPFGFPVIHDSAGKHYIIEFELKNGRKDDQLYINPSSTSLVSVYTSSKKDILHNPLPLLQSRIQFGLENPAYLFAIAFTLLMAYAAKRTIGKTKDHVS